LNVRCSTLQSYKSVDFNLKCSNKDVTAKSPKNAAKTTATLQNQVGKVLLTLASTNAKMIEIP